MNHRENFRRLMAGLNYEHVPLDLPITPPVGDEMERRLGTRNEVQAFDLDFEYISGGGASDAAKWRAAYEKLRVSIPEGAWVGDGGQVERPGDTGSVGAAYHLTEMFHPLSGLETLDEIKDLPWRDLDDLTFYASIPQSSLQIQASGRVAVMGLECSVFERAWYLRGMEQIYCDLSDGNGIADWLFDRFMTQSMRYAAAAAAAGADLIRLGDDVGTQRGMMMSAPFWRTHLKPRLRAIVDAAKSVPNPPYVQYHSDGNITAIVDDLIEIGIDILNPVQPECMPIDDVAARWMDRLAFSGMIGTQTTMPFGSTADVLIAVSKCETWIHRGARMIVGPTHVLEPDVPWDNIVTLVAAIRAIKP